MPSLTDLDKLFEDWDRIAAIRSDPDLTPQNQDVMVFSIIADNKLLFMDTADDHGLTVRGCIRLTKYWRTP